MSDAGVLVIIPTYNEVENVEPIITAIFATQKKLSRHKLEVLIVDDNSPDGTGKLVKKIQKRNKRVHLLEGQKAGIGKAYVRGFAYGLEKARYETFITMDADFSHNPEAIPALLKAMDGGKDYVIGSRYVHGGKIEANWPMRRRIVSRLANSAARLFIDPTKDIRDLTGGFKAMRTSALATIDLSHLRASGNVFIVSLLHEFSSRGFEIDEVPITFTDRRFGASKLRLRDMLEFAYVTYRINPKSRIRRFIRFALVGACGTVVNLAVLVGLVRYSRLSVLDANAIAIEVSIISNFFMNHLYTFRAAITSPKLQRRDRFGAMMLKLARYNVVALGGAAISFLTFAFLYRMLGFHYILADMLAIVVAMSWNYWMSVRVVWRVVDA